MMKKRQILTGFLLIIVSALQAQKPVELPVWENGAPNSNGLTEEIMNDPERPANVVEAKLYVYPAKHSNGMAVICCPGGGYAHLSMANEGYDMADWFNAQGITLAVLKYRMPNGHKEVPYGDVCQAMNVMRQHAAEWHVDPAKIGVMGSSAGGHLAASFANLAPSDLRPAFQILLYPVITMEGYTHGGSRERLLGKSPSAKDIQMFSMEKQVDTLTPPAFIALSADDRTVPPANSLNYAAALGEKGIPYALHVYPMGGHGWGFRDSFPYKRQWTGELEKWLREINK